LANNGLGGLSLSQFMDKLWVYYLPFVNNLALSMI
jgi:hypothetical protein